MKLAGLGEFGLIGRIGEKVGAGSGVLLGIGDDAAEIAPLPGSLLVTSDMLLEGVHFDLSLCDPRTLGRKCLAVNLSDIAAMGAIPRFFLLSLALPPSIEVEFLDSFTDGLLDMARIFGVTLVGGDTCSSRGGLAISITCIGQGEPETTVRRSGGKPGDSIWVTGTVGDSSLGLSLLRQGVRSGEPVSRHLDPLPRVEAGRALALAALPTSMIDLSDGLLADLQHLLDACGAGAEIRLEDLPLSPSYREHAAVCADPFSHALSGGEDYELLFTAPPAAAAEIAEISRRLSLPITRIGELAASPGMRLFSADGSPYQAAARGFDHFRPGN